ncbi:hypothetical protein INR49_007560 [Caranx melampygus]|nr:hypothetical protein INR49_007560 [Caranx melampygus]
MVVVTPVATVSADGEGGVMAAFPRQNLQVEGGDDLRGAWQEGERGEVSSSSQVLVQVSQVFLLQPAWSSCCWRKRWTLTLTLTLTLAQDQSPRPRSWSLHRPPAEAWSSPSGCSSRRSGTDPGTLVLVWTVDGETQRDVTQQKQTQDQFPPSARITLLFTSRLFTLCSVDASRVFKLF